MFAITPSWGSPPGVEIEHANSFEDALEVEERKCINYDRIYVSRKGGLGKIFLAIYINSQRTR